MSLIHLDLSLSIPNQNSRLCAIDFIAADKNFLAVLFLSHFIEYQNCKDNSDTNYLLFKY